MHAVVGEDIMKLLLDLFGRIAAHFHKEHPQAAKALSSPEDTLSPLEPDEEQLALEALPQFDFDYGVTQTGMVKRGNTMRIDCATVFIDRYEDSFLIAALEDEVNTLELRHGVAYKTLVVRFVNTGVGEAQGCRVTVSFGGDNRRFSGENAYQPGQELELALVYPPDLLLNTPVTFGLAFWDRYGNQYLQDYNLHLEKPAKSPGELHGLLLNTH